MKHKKKECAIFKRSPRVPSEERFKMIVEAAAPLFAKNGFSGTTTKQIAKAAGISEALLYKHFPSKDALYKEMQVNSCSAKQTAVEAMLNHPSNTDTLILYLYFFFWHVLIEKNKKEKTNDEHQMVSRLMMHSLLEDGVFAKSFIENSFLPFLEKFMDCVEVGKKAGDIIEDAVPSNLGVWFSHHVVIMINSMTLSGTDVVNYGCCDDELLLNVLHYTLRGLGMKDEVLRNKVTREAIDAMVAKFKKEKE